MRQAQQVGDWNGRCIPTFYSAVTFRSRTEARWAVFFDHLGIEWRYETEGYRTECGWYVPDFWLPQQRYLFEIKPAIGEFDEDLARGKLCHAVELSGAKLGFLVSGTPADQAHEADGTGLALARSDSAQCTNGDHPYLWCDCPVCGRLEMQFDGRSARIKCGCHRLDGDKGYRAGSRRILDAIDVSTAWRFH